MSKRQQEIESRRERLMYIKSLKSKLEARDINVSVADIGNDLKKYESLLSEQGNNDQGNNDQGNNDQSGDGAVIVQAYETKKDDHVSPDYHSLLTEGGGEVFIDESVKKPILVNGKVVIMKLAIVPWHLIETHTAVIEKNARNQDSLNAHNLKYILKTLTDHGQVQEAEGYVRSDGKIMVVDGSSRRYSCVLAKVPFRIFICDEMQIEEQSGTRSIIHNAHKSHSTWEKGNYCYHAIQAAIEESVKDQKSIREARIQAIKDICNNEGITKSRVSLYLGAYTDIPLEIYNSFRAHTSLSRGHISKLLPKIRKLTSSGKIEEFLKSLVPFKESGFKNDKEVFENMEIKINNLLGVEKKPEFVAYENFKVKSSFSDKKGTANIQLKDATPEVLDKLKEFIESIKK